MVTMCIKMRCLRKGGGVAGGVVRESWGDARPARWAKMLHDGQSESVCGGME